MPDSPESMRRWNSCWTCSPISSGVPVSAAALMARPMSLLASSVVKVGAKSLLEAAVGTTPATGYQVRRAQLSPEETDAMSQKTCLSRPSRSARTAPSAVEARLMKSMRLLQILAAWPVVAPPVGMMLAAIGRMYSVASATAPASPPIMKVSVAAFAPLMPPETGASTKRKPAAAAASCRAWAEAMSIVEESTSSVRVSAWARTPSSPRYTARACSPLGSMVKTTSAPSTASAMLPAGLTPPASAAATASGLRSKPRTSCPALARFTDMDPPMFPSPIQAITAMA